MDWKQFIASIVSSLSWPAVTALFLFLFRNELRKIIYRLIHFKYKDLELDFEKVKQEAEKLHENLPQKELDSKNPVLTSFEDQILDAVERAPSAAILLAWSALETAMASAVARLAISPESPSYRSPVHNIDMLSKFSGLSKNYAHLLNEMRILRNKVAHTRDTILSITHEQAKYYANAAFDIMYHLENMQRKKQ